MKRYILTAAVNDTKLHKGFWDSINRYAEFTGAEIKVVAMRYRNPTAKRGKAKRLKDATYDAAVVPFLTNKEERLGPMLTLFADLPVQPTASNALRGNEVYCAGTSAIIGHVKRQMMVVPTDSRTPRVLWTTGACTVAKYSRSRAGARAKKHHVLGAVVVKIESNGTFHVRNVTANRDGSFTDLDTVYAPDGVYEAGRALSLTLGDIHAGQEDGPTIKAARRLVDQVRPLNLVLHDVLDMSSRSHHKQGLRDRYAGRSLSVVAEVSLAVRTLDEFDAWGDHQTHVVSSNHHDHLGRWMNEHKPEQDPINTPYWHTLWSEAYSGFDKAGVWADPFASEYERLSGGAVHFLGREDKLNIGGVAHEFHGDHGVGGTRGSLKGYTRLGVKCTIGHSHTPGILDGVFQAGTSTKLKLDYNSRPSTWLHAAVLLGADGKRQMIVFVKGAYDVV
jgi:hypothetical protein